MCVVSMIYDGAKHNIPDWVDEFIKKPIPDYSGLERRVRELEELIKKAHQYDIDNDQPDCESAAKKAELQKLADEYGVKIEFPDD